MTEHTEVPDTAGWPDGMEMIRQVREALGMFAGAMPITPKEAWEQALERARRFAQGQCGHCLELDAKRPWDVRSRRPDPRDGAGTE